MKSKILVVDDEKEITNLIANYLSLEGYEVHTTNNPLEVMPMIEKDNYQVVITDLMMPELNGLDLIKLIKKFNGLIQVIVITGYVTMSNILTAFRRGASNCFFKPFENLESLKNEVEISVSRFDRIRDVLKALKTMK